VKSLAIGFAYGLIFMFFFFVIGGGGHGLFFPIYAVSAPLSVDPIGILFVPLLTALLAWFSAHRPRWFLLAIAFHSISAIIISTMTYREELGDPYSSFQEKLVYFKWWIVTLAAAYLFGQFLLWFTFAKSSRRQISSS
jgi:hypothetical protein